MKTMMGVYVDAKWAPRKERPISRAELERKRLIRGSDGWKDITYALRKDLPVPEYSEKEVLIRVKSCGICGSDVSLFESDMDGYMSYASQCSFPVIIGHEFSGEIVAAGRLVQSLKIGDFVTAEDNHWCGRCSPCRSGEVNQCKNLKSMGFDRGSNGAMAEYIAVDEKYCWSLNNLRSSYSDKEVFDIGALVEPLSCAYEAIVNVSKGLRPGDHVVILGAGGIGLAALQIVKTCGAAKIIVVEPKEDRRKLAERMGADYVLAPSDISPFDDQTLWHMTDGQGIGMAIEVSHNPASGFSLIEGAMREGGEFLCLSMAAQYPRIDYMKFIRRNITYSGAYGHAGHSNFGQVINLLASKRIDILPAITAEYALKDADKALQAAINREGGKIIIHP